MLLKKLVLMLWAPLEFLLSALLARWVKMHLTREPLPSLKLDRPCLYLMERKSWVDRLVLKQLIQQQGWPRLARLQLGQHQLDSNLLFLEQSPPWRRAFQGAQPTEDLLQAWQMMQAQPETELQVIPVSFYWGRAPRRSESLFKLITADYWSGGGRLHKFFAVLFHGRQLWVAVGLPFLAHQVMSHERLMQQGAEKAAEKTRRLLKLYFRRSRTRLLGPDLSHRRTLKKVIMTTPAVKQAMAEEAAQTSPRQAEEKALKYIDEIASNVSYPVLLLLDRLLNRVWNRIYDGVQVTGLEQFKDQAGRYTLVYLPCHRSHIDYLLLSYVLFQQGLMTPHIAAGVNLNMPVIGPFLRRGGAFFMRRSFKDQPLYRAVFYEYLYTLFLQGHSVEFFVEGGRSRTGRTLLPKPGLLARTLQAQERGTQKPMLLIPIYIGYEKVLEGSTYLSELQGQRKKKESPLDVLRVIKHLRQSFGRVQVNFGQPIDLDSWRASRVDEQALPALQQEIAGRIQQAAGLNRTNLVALSLLACEHRVLDGGLMEQQMQLLADLAQRMGVSLIPEGRPSEWLAAAEAMQWVEPVAHPLGQLYRLNETQAISLTYYRNNTLHLFALPSLMAFLLLEQPAVTEATLLFQAKMVYPLLQAEYFLPPAEEEHALEQLTARLRTTLEQLAEQGLVVCVDQLWQRAEETTSEFSQLQLLGNLVRPALERYYLLLALLEQQGSGQLSVVELIERAQEFVSRLALLQGLHSPEYSDRHLIEQAVHQLLLLGWLREDAMQRLTFPDRLVDLLSQARQLFDPQLRLTLTHLTHWRPREVS